MTTAARWAPAILFAVASAALWTAALMPQFLPVWTGRADALGAVAAHAPLWRVNAALFAVSSAVTVAAVGVLVSAHVAHPLALASVALFAAAAALWVAHNAYRASTMVKVAQDRTPQREALHDLLTPWMNALWLAAAALVIAGFASLGVLILGTGVTAAWAGWFVLASAALSLGFLLSVRDIPPVVAYLPLVPLAVATLLDAAGARTPLA